MNQNTSMVMSICRIKFHVSYSHTKRCSEHLPLIEWSLWTTSTHSINAYQFDLITLQVAIVDNFRDGSPVAWCQSNREDE